MERDWMTYYREKVTARIRAPIGTSGRAVDDQFDMRRLKTSCTCPVETSVNSKIYINNSTQKDLLWQSV
jgi:hypothetical protein